MCRRGLRRWVVLGMQASFDVRDKQKTKFPEQHHSRLFPSVKKWDNFLLAGIDLRGELRGD